MKLAGWVFSSYAVRALWGLSVLTYLGIGIWAALHGHETAGANFGTGLGAVFAAGGWGVRQHDDTRPPS